MEKLEKQTTAKVLRMLDLLERFGADLKMPHSKLVEKGLFELRVTGGQEVRFLYTFQKNHSIIILHAFIKKSQQIPKHELELARARKRLVDSI